MSVPFRVAGAGGLDGEGFVGSGGARGPSRGRWDELGVDPRSGRLRWSDLFDTPFPHYRHLDRLSRVLCIAAELAGLPARPGRSAAAPKDTGPSDTAPSDTAPSDEAPSDKVPAAADLAAAAVAERAARTGLVHAGAYGCLESDWRYERSLRAAAGPAAGLFPYTLPSTSLGELAIRHGLRGPTLYLSVPPGEEALALAEPAAWFASGEAAACLVVLGDWVAPEAAAALGVDSVTEVVALLVEPGDPEAPPEELAELADPARLRAHAPPVPWILRRLRERLEPTDTRGG